ncbi:MAG: hypothetical protein ACW99A_07100 [Candidatus Kariarchaeaceae archaeon]|jgi:hypothetical protein
MLYKLYRNKFKSPPPPERRELFARLYKKHNVEIVGVWKNQDDPLEYYMMTKYKDAAHHKRFVEDVKRIPEYIDMTERINEVRLFSESVNLILAELE